jgi:hypothetical protein
MVKDEVKGVRQAIIEAASIEEARRLCEQDDFEPDWEDDDEPGWEEASGPLEFEELPAP